MQSISSLTAIGTPSKTEIGLPNRIEHTQAKNKLIQSEILLNYLMDHKTPNNQFSIIYIYI